MRAALRSAALALAFAALTGAAHAQLKTSDKVVKAEAKADKPSSDGTQVVTVTLKIDKDWHLYANPVDNDDLTDSQVTVAVSSKNKLEEVKVEYPTGKVVKDKTVGDYKTYEGTVTIKAAVRRAAGDTEPLNVTVKLQACNDTTCLAPGTIKLTVP
jgi:DsbC/DsbD-like thiol-disulfide interchange protein